MTAGELARGTLHLQTTHLWALDRLPSPKTPRGSFDLLKSTGPTCAAAFDRGHSAAAGYSRASPLVWIVADIRRRAVEREREKP